MFGYIKPLKCELKVKEWEHYKAVYCGLCHTLGHQFHLPARFIINYDFTFLALVLSEALQDGTSCEYQYKRCIASPFRKKCAVVELPVFECTAGASVILTWWKLHDSMIDLSFFQSIPARLGAIFLKRSYRKAAKTLPKFDRCVRECLNELQEIERERTDSLDKPADTFARIVAALSDFVMDFDAKRILYQMFYHIGRFIYLLDALNDVNEDFENNNYNPILERFALKEGRVPKKIADEVVFTLNQSIHAAIQAFELLPAESQSALVKNILMLGMPAVVEQVRSGTKPKKEKKLHERSI